MSSQSSPWPRCKGEHEEPDPCPAEPPLSVWARTLEGGSQDHSQVDSRAEVLRFLAPITPGYRQSQQKTYMGKTPLPRVKRPRQGCGYDSSLPTIQCKSCNLPNGTRTYACYFHLPYSSSTSCKPLPIKKGSTFWPDLKAYLLWPTPTPRGNPTATWKGFPIFPLQLRRALESG